jgi:ubiquinone/menaquinone biosynthesis C-methylase UbiE
VTHHFTPETENVEFDDIAKQYDLMAAINSLNRLICYKEWRMYQTVMWHLVLIFSLT